MFKTRSLKIICVSVSLFASFMVSVAPTAHANTRDIDLYARKLVFAPGTLKNVKSPFVLIETDYSGYSLVFFGDAAKQIAPSLRLKIADSETDSAVVFYGPQLGQYFMKHWVAPSDGHGGFQTDYIVTEARGVIEEVNQDIIQRQIRVNKKPLTVAALDRNGKQAPPLMLAHRQLQRQFRLDIDASYSRSSRNADAICFAVAPICALFLLFSPLGPF